MKISELQLRQGNVDIEAEVIEKGDVRTFEKFGKTGRVCNAKIKDDSGEIALTLWNEDIDKVNVGDKIKLTNGYVNEWQGEPQLTTGRMGKLEVVGKGAGKQKADKKTEEPEESGQEELSPNDVDEEEIE